MLRVLLLLVVSGVLLLVQLLVPLLVLLGVLLLLLLGVLLLLLVARPVFVKLVVLACLHRRNCELPRDDDQSTLVPLAPCTPQART